MSQQDLVNKSHKKQHSRIPSSSSFANIQEKTKKFNPRENLTEQQKETLNEMVKEMNLSSLNDKERKFCDDACLLRYLRARDWDVKKSSTMLRNTLKWRESYKPELISAESLSVQASTGKMYRRGSDKQGHPVIYMLPGKENTREDYNKNLQLLVYTMERAIESMPDGVEKMIWFIDFTGFSTSNSMPLSVAKETLDTFSNHYPERLAAAFMVDTPWIFSMMWKAISPLINPVTKQKVQFANGNTSYKTEVLSKFFDMSTIEKKYGGESSFTYVHNVYWGNEVDVDSKRLKRLQPSASSPDSETKKAFSDVPNVESNQSTQST